LIPRAKLKWLFPIPGGPNQSRFSWLSTHRKSSNCDTSDFAPSCPPRASSAATST
jgi:hypothetical protein